jgi:hypothetical protein
MAITFDVDSVTPVTDELPRRPAHEAFSAHTGAQLYVLSHEPELIVEDRGPIFNIENPLMAAVHRAFSQHRPLRLTPDHVWLTISQGFAFHVDTNAEALRERFVRHEGRTNIDVVVDHSPFTEGGWAQVIERFGAGIAEHVGPGVHRLLVSDFSTTTPIAKTASEVVMMSAFKRYFDYRMVCICGIPRVTLEGTPEDWRTIRDRVRVLGEYDLAWWTEKLAPICDELVKTAEGEPDVDFWQCMYMPAETYGGELATGWIARLFPYLQDSAGQVRVRNPALEDQEPAPPPEEADKPGLVARLFGKVQEVVTTPERRPWINGGIDLSSAPSGVSEAPLVVVEPLPNGEEKRRHLRLFGGFIGVSQDEAGVIAPELGWAIGEPTRMARVLDRLDDARHDARPPGAVDYDGEYPGALLQLWDRHAQVTLHGRARVRPAHEVFSVAAPPTGFQGVAIAPPEGGWGPGEQLVLQPIVDLKDDPRWIGLDERFSCVLVDPRRAQSAEELPVVALDVETLLERLLDGEGALFFDAPGFVPEATLYDHLGHSDILRAALSPGHAVPSDLSKREKERVILLLWNKEGTRAERDHWWAALQESCGLDDKYRKIIEKQKRKHPYAVMEEIGLVE